MAAEKFKKLFSSVAVAQSWGKIAALAPPTLTLTLGLKLQRSLRTEGIGNQVIQIRQHTTRLGWQKKYLLLELKMEPG